MSAYFGVSVTILLFILFASTPVLHGGRINLVATDKCWRADPSDRVCAYSNWRGQSSLSKRDSERSANNLPSV